MRATDIIMKKRGTNARDKDGKKFIATKTELTPEELSVSVTVEADLELSEELYEEIGPGIGMAPEGFGSGGKWTSSARLERILGPGEDPEHPRFYNIVNGKITGIVVR